MPDDTVKKVDGFKIYVSTSRQGGYECVGSRDIYYMTSDTYSCMLWMYNVTPGTYYFKTKTYNYTSNGTLKYSDYSSVTSFQWIWNLKAVPAGNTKVNLISNAVTGTLGSVVEGKIPQEYEIYRSASENGPFILMTSFNNRENDLEYTDQQVSLGNIYYYKVKALFYDEETYNTYTNSFDYDDYYDFDHKPDGDSIAASGNVKPKPIYTMETNVTEGHPGPISTTSLSSTAQKENVLKLSWKSVKDVNGYYLYETYNNSRKMIAKISGNKTTYTWKKRKHGINYQIVVVPYVNVNGKEVTGADSSVFSATMNYYTSPYDNKITRFFGKNAYQKYSNYENRRHSGKPYYSSEKTACKQMKTIVIKVWDYKNGKSGKKITRKFKLTVHKKVAPSLKRAFDEIYKGKEKFPIHDIGGYSYRWGQHGVGLAIDINSNENAQFKNGKAVVGSFYRPGKNPYSIPKDGEVARILHKYGFDQLEGDYMHFSYFGT